MKVEILDPRDLSRSQPWYILDVMRTDNGGGRFGAVARVIFGLRGLSTWMRMSFAHRRQRRFHRRKCKAAGWIWDGTKRETMLGTSPSK